MPDAFVLLQALVLLTVLAGLLGLLLRRNLFLKALAMDVMGTGVVALFVLVAARPGLRTPILSALSTPAGTALPAVPAAAWADPIPQAVILTAIVIGLSIQALLLVVITRLAQLDPLLDTTSFEEIQALMRRDR
ncbi:MAG: NADH-quinone oxidoreductase subunit K [Synechococcus sp.]|nr:NADH-quinone oxidoreductase subunit K [Synechococcus sp.]